MFNCQTNQAHVRISLRVSLVPVQSYVPMTTAVLDLRSAVQSVDVAMHAWIQSLVWHRLRNNTFMIWQGL